MNKASTIGLDLAKQVFQVHGAGTLTVSSGTTEVAQINIVGTYTSANFSAGADSQGNV
jgi:hypothetical protein